MLLPSERAKQPNSTRELLSHIGWLSEELLRASQEKVNLAQATYDSVRPILPYRCIHANRGLDRAPYSTPRHGHPGAGGLTLQRRFNPAA